ncbi:MAG: DUF1810 domain-containing protein [Oscillospiraceae bacterium]|nr:DUF1810 domain-containing protein [Oscillospiraceae bacterium]
MYYEERGLDKYVRAQERDYADALREIKSGRKRSHWIWYIFPQMDGLGFSPTAQYYGIRDLEQAKDYMAHPVLGPRLVEISEALLELPSSDPGAVMGYPDDLKLCSSMTLFELAAPEEPVFGRVLDKFYGGRRDPLTLELLGMR